MQPFVIIFACVVSVIMVSIAVLLFFLFLQRRRQRAFLMHSIAQEEAERRRRKRKKAGLRRWEIDHACPEAVVSEISPTASTLEIFNFDTHPEQYNHAVSHLRSMGVSLEPTPRHYHSPQVTKPTPADQVSPPSPPLLKPSHHSILPEVRSDVPSDTTDEPPLQLVTIPQSMETCVICLDDIDVGARVRSLPCRHVYHSQCIRVWLRRKNACPCCCMKVIKRRKRREKSTDAPHEHALGVVRESHLPEQPPRTPSPQARLLPDTISADDLMPIVAERRADRDQDVVIDFREQRSKSMSCCDDRPRTAAVNIRPALGRSGSGLDPEEVGSGVLASEASSHLDEPSAAELLEQVRKALRGESSMISLAADDVKSDIDEDSFRDAIRPHRNVDLELGSKQSMVSVDTNHE